MPGLGKFFNSELFLPFTIFSSPHEEKTADSPQWGTIQATLTWKVLIFSSTWMVLDGMASMSPTSSVGPEGKEA